MAVLIPDTGGVDSSVHVAPSVQAVTGSRTAIDGALTSSDALYTRLREDYDALGENERDLVSWDRVSEGLRVVEQGQMRAIQRRNFRLVRIVDGSPLKPEGLTIEFRDEKGGNAYIYLNKDV